MAAIEICALTAKLRLLASHGGFADMPALAERFKVSVKTLYGWGRGREDRGGGDRLPARHLPMFLALMEECLGAGYSRDRLKEIALAPLGAFEMALGSGARDTLSRLVEKEGRRGGFRLATRDKTLGLADSDEDVAQEPDLHVARNTWFRLDVPTPIRSPHAFALQTAAHRWALHYAQVDLGKGRIRIPGRKRDGSPGHIREAEQYGPHRFIVIQSQQAIPHTILRYRVERIELDMAALGRIAAFYEEQPKNRRALFVADIEVI